MTADPRPLAPQGVDAIDDKVRQRLSEMLAAAGVPHAQITLAVLYYLPKDFLNAYEQMFTAALKADGGESARNSAQAAAGDLGKATGGKSGGGKRYKKTFVVMDERALAMKTQMDKRLRAIGREILDRLAGGDPVNARPLTCEKCGQFMQRNWRYCPGCGNDSNQ